MASTSHRSSLTWLGLRVLALAALAGCHSEVTPDGSDVSSDSTSDSTSDSSSDVATPSSVSSEAGSTSEIEDSSTEVVTQDTPGTDETTSNTQVKCDTTDDTDATTNPADIQYPACPFAAGVAAFYLPDGNTVFGEDADKTVDSGWIGCLSNNDEGWVGHPSFKRRAKGVECLAQFVDGGCMSDSECGVGESCLCTGNMYPGQNAFWDNWLVDRPHYNTPFNGDCIPDRCEGECNGLGCGLNVDMCGAEIDLRCHTPQDECQIHDDCCPQGLSLCVYDETKQHWGCIARADCE